MAAEWQVGSCGTLYLGGGQAEEGTGGSCARAGLWSDASSPPPCWLTPCSAPTGSLKIPGLSSPPVSPGLSQDCVAVGREGWGWSHGCYISETLTAIP